MKEKLKCSLLFGILSTVKHEIKISRTRALFYRKYRDANQLIPANIFPVEIVEAGKNSYGELNVVTFGMDYKLIIGNYVSIAQDVKFILQAEHYVNHMSTYPFRVKLLGEKKPEAFAKGDIIVKDDAWIGYGSIIMSGVTIGQGAIVAAGSVVTKDVPPYAIVGGVPAKIIKYRFCEETIEKLKKVNYKTLEKDAIANNIDALYMDLSSVENIERFNIMNLK